MKPCSLLQLTSCPPAGLLALSRLLWAVSRTDEPKTQLCSQSSLRPTSALPSPPARLLRAQCPAEPPSWLPGPSVPAWLVPVAAPGWCPSLGARPAVLGRAHPRSCRSSLSAAAGPPRCLSRPALSAAFPAAYHAVQSALPVCQVPCGPPSSPLASQRPSAQSWCPFTGTLWGRTSADSRPAERLAAGREPGLGPCPGRASRVRCVRPPGLGAQGSSRES